MFRLAASSPWPIILFWGFILLLARAGKKKAPPRRMISSRPGQEGSRAELGDALQRAMEKLKQAERETQARRTAGQADRRTVGSVVLSGRPAVRPSTRLVLEDHSAQSQESEPDVVDYDDEAAQLEERRVREAVDAFERTDAAASLRVSAPTPAASARPPVRPSAAPLARFADGSLKGAIVLSEILGRPISDR